MFQFVIIFSIYLWVTFAQYQPFRAEDAARAANFSAHSKQYYWELSGQFEGDIILSPEQKDRMTTRNMIPPESIHLWPNAELVIAFDPAISTFDAAPIYYGLDIIASKTCVTYRLKNGNDQDYVYITNNKKGCTAEIGRVGGRQNLNLENNFCTTPALIIHEFLHSLGFAHMQNDPMRDDYVYVYWNNIIPNVTFNFNLHTNVSSYDFPYDYDSVMHYSAYAFSSDGESPTMSRLQEPFFQLGNNVGLSYYDIKKINYLYNCK